jgi:hypothetical protein
MTPTIAYCTLIVSAGIIIVLSAYAPLLLSDANRFLREFVNHEFLSVLGVILAITLASTAQLHLTLNQIEERYKQAGGLSRTKVHVHRAAHCLIWLFVAGVTVVVLKPILAIQAWRQSLFNGMAIFIIVWNVLILMVVTRTVFKIKPKIDDD